MGRNRIAVDSEYGKFVVDKQDFMKFQRNYMAMNAKIRSEIGDDDRIKYIMFYYNDKVNGIVISFYTNRCTLYSTDEVFLPNHENDNAVVSNAIAAWMKLPLTESDKEQYAGVWKTTGKKIKFNRMWGNYRFSDAECDELLEGNHITFITDSNGEQKTFCGHLEQQEYGGFRYFGFKLHGWAMPNEFHRHIITPAERQDLLAGKEVYLDGVWSEGKHKFYDAYFTYNINDGIKLSRFS